MRYRRDTSGSAVDESSGKRGGGVKSMVAVKVIDRSPEEIRPGLRVDVDDASAGATQLGRVIRAIDLEFLYGLLTQSRTHSAPGGVHFAPVQFHTVAPAIVAVK